LSGLLFLVFCAKKMLPPSPDRFSPYLLEVNPRSRVQLELIFNEEIDPGRLVAESVKIAGLNVRGVSIGRQSSRVLVWTEPQERKGYSIRVVVWDLAGNLGRFRAVFRGSSRMDTIPPQVVSVAPTPGTKGLFRNIRVVLRFSEPIDTTSPVNYIILPKGTETVFRRLWSPNWQELRFECRDSLPGEEFYFLLLPGVVDLENNRCLVPGWTFWSADTGFKGVRVIGRTFKDGERVRSGIVFFEQEKTKALAPILSDGLFDLRLREGEWTVLGVSDTNFDGMADLVTQRILFNTADESLKLYFGPESLPRLLNEYCH